MSACSGCACACVCVRVSTSGVCVSLAEIVLIAKIGTWQFVSLLLGSSLSMPRRFQIADLEN